MHHCAVLPRWTESTTRPLTNTKTKTKTVREVGSRKHFDKQQHNDLIAPGDEPVAKNTSKNLELRTYSDAFDGGRSRGTVPLTHGEEFVNAAAVACSGEGLEHP